MRDSRPGRLTFDQEMGAGRGGRTSQRSATDSGKASGCCTGRGKKWKRKGEGRRRRSGGACSSGTAPHHINNTHDLLITALYKTYEDGAHIQLYDASLANPLLHVSTINMFIAGAVARIMDRGTRGINFLLSAMVFNVAPTVFEIAVVTAILTIQCGPMLGVLTLGTLAGGFLCRFSFSFFTCIFLKSRIALGLSLGTLASGGGRVKA